MDRVRFREFMVAGTSGAIFLASAALGGNLLTFRCRQGRSKRALTPGPNCPVFYCCKGQINLTLEKSFCKIRTGLARR